MNNIVTQKQKDKIDVLSKRIGIYNYTINNDGSIDVNNNVHLSKRDISSIPLRFGRVSGAFYCKHNRLTSLVGIPTSVGGSLDFSYNRLTTLEGCPKYVGGDFDCSENRLSSLEGCPTTVTGDFSSTQNELTSLEFSPTSVGGDFWCTNNILTSLKGCPTSVGGNFYFYGNNLPSAFSDTFYQLSFDEQQMFYNYQYDYEVWYPEFNIENMNDLIADIKDGLK